MPITLLLILFSLPFAAQAKTCNMHDRLNRELPATKLLELSREAMKDQHYCEASKLFQEVILQHPSSKEAKKAQLEIIQALASAKLYKEAIRSAKEFLVFFPRYRGKEELLRYIQELELEEKRAKSQRGFNIEDFHIDFVGLPTWRQEANGYMDPGNEGAIGAMIRIYWPF